MYLKDEDSSFFRLIRDLAGEDLELKTYFPCFFFLVYEV
jgi:hypothetical protein